MMNFKMLKSALAYARDKAETLDKQVNASLTTNATLLREEIIDWMVENFSCSFATLVESAELGRNDELSFFCTSPSLPWNPPPPSR